MTEPAGREAEFTTAWTPTVVDPVVKAPKKKTSTDTGRRGVGTPAARAASLTPFLTLAIPTTLSILALKVPEIADLPYLSRALAEVQPLIVEPLVVLIRDGPPAIDGVVLLWGLFVLATVGLAASTRARWGGNPTILYPLAAVVASGMLVRGLVPDLAIDRAAGIILAVHAAAAAGVAALVGMRAGDPEWAGRGGGGLCWKWVPVLYTVTVVGPIAIGRTIFAPGPEVTAILDKVFNQPVPDWVAPALNGVWIGIAAWCGAQLFTRPAWRRISFALLLLALAVGPLRDVAHVAPLFPAGWRGWKA